MKTKYCPECGSRTEGKVAEDKERAYCNSCDKILWRNPKPASATLLKKNSEVLLVKRGIEPDKRKWSLPAGFIEYEESFRTGALRELEDETGLKAEKEDLEILETLKITNKTDEHVVVAVFKIEIEKTKGKPKAGYDAQKAEYWSKEKINQNTEKIRKPYRDIIKNF